MRASPSCVLAVSALAIGGCSGTVVNEGSSRGKGSGASTGGQGGGGAPSDAGGTLPRRGDGGSAGGDQSGTGGNVGRGKGASDGAGGTPPIACTTPVAPIVGLASAIATENAGSATLSVNLSSSSAATCTDPLNFPDACATAWRVRLDIPYAQQAPGTYQLFMGSPIFAYLDAQAPGPGTFCDNPGGDLAAVLVITEIDATHVSGSLCGDARVEGTFKASLCGTCQGTGMTCTVDADCCNQLCSGGRCPP